MIKRDVHCEDHQPPLKTTAFVCLQIDQVTAVKPREL